jgi:ribose transport system permease protein
LLPAFAAMFLGATQIHPGRPNVFGTLLAVAVLGAGVKGLLLTGAQFWVSDLFNGLALVAAVALARRRGRSSG